MVEIDKEYCLYTIKRLMMAEKDNTIQGYSNGVFWERNTLKDIKNNNHKEAKSKNELFLFSNVEGGSNQ